MTIAHSRDNPSKKYQELAGIYQQLHDKGFTNAIKKPHLFSGHSLYKHIPQIRAVASATGAKTILDYGSGKGRLYAERNLKLADGSLIHSVQEYWRVDSIRCFDPGVPEFAEFPTTPFDGVVCTDVLEHIPEEDVPWVLAELFSLARRFVYANIAAYPAGKTLPNGWNAHVTVQPPAWWKRQILGAAKDWQGQAFEFQIQETRRIPDFIRKRLKLRKLKTTYLTSVSPKGLRD